MHGNRKDTLPDDTGLTGMRERIDALDEAILDLLNQRAEVSLEVGRHKAGSAEPIFKPRREKEVITRLQVLNPGPLPDRHLYSIYREIMSSSRRLQRPERVVYLGPEGTFSYFAGIEFMGHMAELTPKSNLGEVFRAVAEGGAELGIVPLENSLQGTVGQTVDLFMRYPVFVQAELYSRISHALLAAVPGLGHVTRVYSHSKALGQCGEWLEANLPEAPRLPMSSTAAAARLARDAGDGSAVVGHVRLAELFGLNVLAEHLEDLPDNWTRFLVIAPAPGQEKERDKSSILFTTPDRPGALGTVLEIFSRRGVNLSKLESRPSRGERWKYVFFADLECDLADPAFKPLTDELRDHCHTLRFLGSYPAGPHLENC
ncbi:chorismate mutase [Paucidesulfovibrio gracilis DSM 16080]|uniref:Bifunctional chorismate mutase/prephenate dehydratase n=1 Tax=Paucidesulfovibrio gracilis DSM 16080 TaxID=1121449 RepID=A0A1T4W3Y4_9BACT|nr:prephenate dehydratase [Paucidesulfovibrio gracilis]SKA71952.1 chorismate mutase [Paucidesulfovibrio gracilis DSM 16080]